MFCRKWPAFLVVFYVPSIVLASLPSYVSNDIDGSHINLAVQYKTAGKMVNYSPNLPAGGLAVPDKRTRFSERAALVSWNSGRALSVSGVLTQRNFTSLRDNFEFNGIGLGASYRLNLNGRGSTMLSFDWHSNGADVIDKNSFTTIDSNVIKGLSVRNPSDQQWALGLNRNLHLSPSSNISLFAGFGGTDTKHEGITGKLSRGDCNYFFNFNDQGGKVSQVESCGSIIALTRTYPTDASVEQDFGVSPNIDLRNKSTFYRVGASAVKRFDKWTFSSGYYFQKYSREFLDDRIIAANGRAHDSNQTFSALASYQFNKQLSFSTAVEYHKHRYLDQVPVLYTRLTSQRFDEPAAFFSISLKYRFSI